MTFYESERIVRKQQKYEKLKAYEAISKLENKGLSTTEMIDALNILIKDDNTEFRHDVLNRAKAILTSRKESDSDNEGSSINNFKLKCNNESCPVILN